MRLGPGLLGAALLWGCVTSPATAPPARGRAAASTPAASTPGAPTQAPARAATPDAGLPALAARVLPAVVLVVNERPDGRTTYGAGVLVGEGGQVLTNLHVADHARRLRVLLYRAGRASYTPMDGGLTRYLFENARELLTARLVKRDDTVDLALLAVDGDTSGHPSLPFATRPVQVGERVLALGHPGESVWSFTSGVVSALPQGTIQHDAAVNGGNSGGPLVNLAGEIVGINTAKALSGTEGVAFARPVAIARRLLEATPGGEVDLTDLERAVLGCFHAQELASPGMVQCFDYRGQWTLYQAAVDAVAKDIGLDGAGRRAFRAALLAGGVGAFVRDRNRAWRAMKGAAAHKSKVHAECGQSVADPRCGRPAILAPVYRQVPQARAQARLDQTVALIEQLMARSDRRLREDAGFQGDLTNAAALQRTLRQGIRIDAIRHRGPDRAWVLIAGRNVDGSPYHLTEWWRRRGGVWHQQFPVPEAVVGNRPPGWPRPMGDEALSSAGYRAKVLSVLAARCCLPPDRQGDAPVARRPKR